MDTYWSASFSLWPALEYSAHQHLQYLVFYCTCFQLLKCGVCHSDVLCLIYCFQFFKDIGVANKLSSAYLQCKCASLGGKLHVNCSFVDAGAFSALVWVHWEVAFRKYVGISGLWSVFTVITSHPSMYWSKLSQAYTIAMYSFSIWAYCSSVFVSARDVHATGWPACKSAAPIPVSGVSPCSVTSSLML